MFWLLAREVLRMRAVIPRTEPWSVAVDLFLYREPEEAEKKDEADAAPADAEGNTFGDAAEETTAKPAEWTDVTETPYTGGASWTTPAAAPAGGDGWVPSAQATGWDGAPEDQSYS